MTTHKHWVAEVLRSWATTFNITLAGYLDDEEMEMEKGYEEAYNYVHLLADKLLNDTCTIDDYSNILFHLFQKFENDFAVSQLHSYPRWKGDKSCPIHPQEEFVSDYIKLRFWRNVKNVRDEAIALDPHYI